MLGAWLKRTQGMEAIWSNRSDGSFVFSEPEAGLLNARGRDWWRKAMAGETYISEVYLSAITKRPCLTVSMPLRWEDLPDVDPDDFDVLTAAGVLAERGDALAGLHDDPGSLETALEWVERDQRDHDLGDLPYPPEYPKMPGEPKRVQPSREKRVSPSQEG